MLSLASLLLLAHVATAIERCSDDSEFDVASLEKVSLASEVPTIPWIDGEHYTTAGSKTILQCKLPHLPTDSLVLITYATNFVKNIRNVVTRYRNPEEEMKHFFEPDTCIITTLFPNLTESAVPEGLEPTRCGSSRSVILDGKTRMKTEISDKNRNHQLGYSVHTASKVVSLEFPSAMLNQTGSYQCIIIRTCDPGILNSTEDAQAEENHKHAIGVYRSVFLKVYTEPQYKDDILIACGGLGIGSVALLLTVFISRGSKFQ